VNAWLNEVHDFTLSLVPMQTLNTKITRTAKGIAIEAQAGGGASAPPGMKFQGEWSSASSYFAAPNQDVVVIRGGVSAGTYVCVRNAPAGTPPPGSPDPTVGTFWVSIASGDSRGAWV
jgi:hypothetical protein